MNWRYSSAIFSPKKGMKLVWLNQERLRVIGGEVCERENVWLVSDLSLARQP
jgi:hypothetical protein